LQGRVVVSHAFCLGMLATRERDALLSRMVLSQQGVLVTWLNRNGWVGKNENAGPGCGTRA
jgi:hypothetical protein